MTSFKSQKLDMYRDQIRSIEIFDEIANGESFSFFVLKNTNYMLKTSMIGKRWVKKLLGVGFSPEVNVKFDEILESVPPDIQMILIFNLNLFR